MIFFASTPEKWIRTHVGNYCDVQIGKMLQNDPSSERDELKPYLRAINIGKEGLDLSHEFSMWIRPQEVERFRLRIGDVLVSEGGDAGRATTFNADGEYYFQNAINRVRPNHLRKIESEFIYYWFTFLKVSGYVEMICNVATIPHFTAEKVKAAPLALPPLDTQRRIAQFLDEKTARINALVGKKRELLERLAEKRQALITRAVTKGLDPDAPMPQSDQREHHQASRGDYQAVEATGGMTGYRLPVGWSSKRLKYLATYNDEVLSENTDEDQEIDYVEISGVSLSRGIEELERITFGQAPSRARRKLRRGDILISTVRTYLRAITRVDKASPDLIASTGFCVVRPKNNVDSGFLGWVAQSEPFVSEVVACSVGVSYPAINASALVTIEMPIPPLDTQRQIAQFLDEKTSQIDEQCELIVQSLETLVEYRTALITAAATGKIDVCNIKQPTEVEPVKKEELR